MVRIWNTKSKSLEEIKPIRSGTIGFYACGPTVYGRAHIGNLRSYVMEDILRRTLEVYGHFQVNHAMNITDVGHLTGDVDDGEDKVERAAREEGTDAWTISKRYTAHFLEDIKAMNILEPTEILKATDHIDEQIELVKVLEDKGYTYTTNDGVYFDTSKFSDYGKLSGQPLQDKEEGARVALNAEKRNAADFALWKFSPKNEKRQMEWESPWGVGFPGWHLECSAMSRKALGQPFDIHAGGVDHIPTHHENEIAQSVAAYGVPLANYWVHVEHMLVDGQKMSKSLKNTYTVEDVRERGFSPMDYRYFLLGAHYRQKQNFTWEALAAAQSAMKKLKRIVREFDRPADEWSDVDQEFQRAIEDDLNTPKGLAALWKLLDSDLPSSQKAGTIVRMDAILGLELKEIVGKPLLIPQEVTAIADRRLEARKNRDWERSDTLRDQLLEKGWIVRDEDDGYTLERN